MRSNGIAAAPLSPDDRGLHYGDGLFETLAVRNGQPCLWRYHLERLLLGCRRLAIPPPAAAWLRREAAQEIGDNAVTGVLKILYTRGPAQRGYAPPADPQPTCLLRYTPAPPPAEQAIHVRTCRTPIGISPALAGLKHLNRLEQVLARSEWSDPNIAEGIMCDPEGQVIEGTASNLLLWHGTTLTTPDLSRSGVAGVVRRLLLEQAAAEGIEIAICSISRRALQQADGLLLSNALIGLRQVASLDGRPLTAPFPYPELQQRVTARTFTPESA